MKRPNGWLRLWLVFCGVLGVFCGAVAWQVNADERLFMLWVWLVPCASLYVLGWAFVWVVHGFKSHDQ
ncbi:hypothetical protein [Pseudomonas chlororaphis]|uniref:Uncharacterized protein n=1 Tax=Pseudomonas chlororaphis TaxID=587753 RepID=A0AAX3FWZ8_9PSED|nr:hypothetical protein [Pseudomonas chlororaphis]AZC39432.1 hypothetical protein C4K37_5067 [Pseudomonas chlororaphis subsp. piscium]AZC45984.1 hypothetical protein C4K36_5081 [Pseudomonas chlororaphis subsp. piscium]AZC52719.1 hypothetical protein C4K35_5158 [Pseudomonas chlororaphis subsp. piscium]WDG71517.1 hypothetical protein PUP65_25955 [Pseudomonas chlororaphis]WDH30699.1 hypothetical protein PUP81_08365 [Pseudomonas chlororaphis]